MDIAFDIETIRNGSLIDRLPEIEVKTGNMKEPAKIEEKKADAKAEQIRNMTLNPLYGRICAFVAIADNGRETQFCIAEDSDAEETVLIETAFSALATKRVITYNGTSFDLPFLYRRAVLLGIDPRQYGMPTLAEMTKRYGNENHVDVMTTWCGFGQYEKLDNLAGALGAGNKVEIDFNDFPVLICTAEGQKTILDYCRQDVALTLAIWNRINGILI